MPRNLLDRVGRPTIPGERRALLGLRQVRRLLNVAHVFALRHPVELIGIEPTTSGLQSQRSPN